VATKARRRKKNNVVTKCHKGRSGRRWEDNINVDPREIEWGGMDLIGLVENSGLVEGSCEHGNELSATIKCWETAQLAASQGLISATWS
jgi:hypothetical protein